MSNECIALKKGSTEVSRVEHRLLSGVHRPSNFLCGRRLAANQETKCALCWYAQYNTEVRETKSGQSKLTDYCPAALQVDYTVGGVLLRSVDLSHEA
jgi:hypothetical protein